MLLQGYSELSDPDSITYFKTKHMSGSKTIYIYKTGFRLLISPGIITKERKGRISIPDHEILKAYSTVPPKRRQLLSGGQK